MKSKSFVLSILVTLILMGCSKQSFDIEVPKHIQADAIAYYGKVVSITDFPQSSLIDESYISSLSDNVISGAVGSTPDKAYVVLIFDDLGVLYTATRYNQEVEQLLKNKIEQEIGEKLLYTDLQTFKKITNLSEATSEYADAIPNRNAQPIWSFDPYVKFFEKSSEKFSVNFNSFVTKSVPAWAKNGTIVFAQWTGGGIADTYGHTGGISKEPSSSSTDVGYLMRSTKTVEASNNGKNLAGITIGTQDGVFERYMSSNGSDCWNHSTCYNRAALWYSSMTSTNRSNIVTYMKSQIGESYNLSSSKTNSTQWYCSKLQWKAYNYELSIDVDKNGGYTVYPKDIAGSSLLVGMSFWSLI